jgi:hypothetical protein
MRPPDVQTIDELIERNFTLYGSNETIAMLANAGFKE